MSELPRVAGVRFRNAGKIYYYDTVGMRLETGEHVIVETARGPEIARVVIAPDQVVVNEMGKEDLKPILRLATREDIEKADELQQRLAKILPEARRLADGVGFRGRIESASFTLDGRRLTFAFSSEGRQDYREFVRAASREFQTRTDMTQVGARDRAKLAGGYGICGRELCCASWLTTFPSISIRMAKDQDLPLNPTKISGLCGRLLCCLSYEDEGYKRMRKTLPKVGQRCSTPTGEGKAIAVNILKRQVTLLVDGKRIEVPDRDLGTVVRWDATSKSADPPPSITREEGIAQGIIEADQIDEAGGPVEPETDPYTVDAGRGRLPVAAPRREAKPRNPVKPSAREAVDGTSRDGTFSAPKTQRIARGRPSRTQAIPSAPGTAPLPEGRIFRRGPDDGTGQKPTTPGREHTNERTPDTSAAAEPSDAPRRTRRRKTGRRSKGPSNQES